MATPLTAIRRRRSPRVDVRQLDAALRRTGIGANATPILRWKNRSNCLEGAISGRLSVERAAGLHFSRDSRIAEPGLGVLHDCFVDRAVPQRPGLGKVDRPQPIARQNLCLGSYCFA